MLKNHDKRKSAPKLKAYSSDSLKKKKPEKQQYLVIAQMCQAAEEALSLLPGKMHVPKKENPEVKQVSTFQCSKIATKKVPGNKHPNLNKTYMDSKSLQKKLR